ncbi:hypothetical protein AAAC51_20355 [Priestia megaterium]
MKKKDLKTSKELASCEYLAINWKRTLNARAEKGEELDVNRRVYGPNI